MRHFLFRSFLPILCQRHEGLRQDPDVPFQGVEALLPNHLSVCRVALELCVCFSQPEHLVLQHYQRFVAGGCARADRILVFRNQLAELQNLVRVDGRLFRTAVHLQEKVWRVWAPLWLELSAAAAYNLQVGTRLTEGTFLPP